MIPGPEAWAGIATPALVVDAAAVEANLGATLGLLGGNPGRWRPHLKTAKLAWTMRRIVARGVEQAKVATTLELETALEAGFADVLLAYPAAGPAVARTRALAERFPGARVAALVEAPEMVAPWRGGRVALFVDLDIGMGRTGVPLGDHDRVLALVREIETAGLRFGGLHAYDGHAASFPEAERGAAVRVGCGRVLDLVRALRTAGVEIPEVITAGTPAFPHAAGWTGLAGEGVLHRLSPGTVVYNDARSLTQLPAGAGYRPAALVLSRVVSLPAPGRATCDAGHKTVSADAGDPTCEVLGRPGWRPAHPSEEHLPIELPAGQAAPARGELVWLLPRHICPTVNNFDEAVLVAEGRIVGVERVTARGRHGPAG